MSIVAAEAPAVLAVRATSLAAMAVLRPAWRILVFGIKPSALLARYAAFLLARMGRATPASDATGLALADQLHDLGAGDALLVFAYGHAYRVVAAVLAEARQRNLPVVLVTDSLEERLARQADAVVPAHRARARGLALHSTTLVVLAVMVLGVADTEGERAVAALERLDELRAAVASVHRNM